MSLLFIPIFIFIFSFLIIVHEFGHFYAARKSGVKVEEFGLGIGPKIYGKKFGETEYTLNLIPFGGFVRMLGEEESSKDSRSFEQAKL
jgi:regulator of sigma E protease